MIGPVVMLVRGTLDVCFVLFAQHEPQVCDPMRLAYYAADGLVECGIGIWLLKAPAESAIRTAVRWVAASSIVQALLLLNESGDSGDNWIVIGTTFLIDAAVVSLLEKGRRERAAYGMAIPIGMGAGGVLALAIASFGSTIALVLLGAVLAALRLSAREA